MSFLANNLLTVLSSFLPAGAVIVYVAPFTDKKIVGASMFVMPLVSLYIFFGGAQWDTEPAILFLYPLFFLAFLLTFTRKLPIHQALALSMVCGFLMTELHEIFFWAGIYLGLYTQVPPRPPVIFEWYSPLAHLMVPLSFWLALKLGKIQVTKEHRETLLLFLLGLLGYSFGEFTLTLSYTAYLFNTVLKRLYVFLFLELFLYRYSRVAEVPLDKKTIPPECYLG